MKRSSSFASLGAHVDSKSNSQLRRSSRVSSSNGFQLKAPKRPFAVGKACTKAKDHAKALCQSKGEKALPCLLRGDILYLEGNLLFSPVKRQVKNNLQFLTTLPAVLHESKAKQPAGCVFRAD